MARFYAIAALIVVAIGSALYAHRLAAGGPAPRARTHASPPPPAGNANAGFTATPPPYFSGEGGWVLSALPGCFEQLSSIEGPSQALVFHVPPDRARIAPGTRIRRGNCILFVRAHDLWVERGSDRLRVPPEARLFAAGGGLTLVFEHAGRTEVRVYRGGPG